MYIELRQAFAAGTVGFDASRIECVKDNRSPVGNLWFTSLTGKVLSPSCTITLRSGATFHLAGFYPTVVARIHKATEEADRRAKG